MKINLLKIFTLLIFAALLAGCGFEHENGVHREPIDISQWPSPVPPTPSTEPTPFPKSTLPPTVAPVEVELPDTSQTEASTADVDDNLTTFLDGDATALIGQISSHTGGLTPAGAALITTPDAAIRQAPDVSAETVDTLSQGNLAGILGQNSGGDWYFVITQNLAQGWLAVGDARVAGQMAEIPVLPNEQATASAAPEQGADALSGDILNQIMAIDSAGPGSNILSAGLAPKAIFTVNVAETAIRHGPGSGYGLIDVIEQGKVGGILGKNSDGSWLYIITIDNELGWTLQSDLRVVGTLAEAPVLPNNPTAAFAQSVPEDDSIAPSGSSSDTSADVVDIASIDSAATATVSSALVNLRQRPGGSYKQLGTLAENTEVAILGLNRDRAWALVTAAGGATGWASTDYLDVGGSLENAPVFRTLEPANATQVAPVVEVSGSFSRAATAAASGSTGTATAVVAADSGVASLPANTISPSATANINEKVDLRAGPGEQYGALSTATVDELVTVMAVNTENNWALIRQPNGKMGWVPQSKISVTNGFIENAQPVVTALVSSDNLPVLSGPGIFYDTAGLVNRNNFVSLLGINPGRNWVLAETGSGTRGWIQLRLVDNITGSLDELPSIEVDPLAQSGPTGPQPSAPSGKPTGTLVFQTSSGGDIMRINTNGSGLQKITNGIDPVLSPDGGQIAFTRWQGDSGTLWIANTDGSGERPLLGEMRKAKGPDWSPDGSQIVLNYQHGGRVDAKRECIPLGRRPPMNATDFRIKYNDKGIPVALCFTIPPDPHWSLRVVNISDGSFQDLYGGQYAFRPAWDPGQTWRIVSAAGNGLLAVDINRDEYRQQLTEIIGDGSPAISPDGQFIAAVTKGQDGNNIYRMNADGSGRVRLTQTPLWEGIRPDQEAKPWNNVAPAWSPDGTRIAFLTDRAGRWEIWLMNADGSNPQPMFAGEINEQITIEYNFVDERALSWR